MHGGLNVSVSYAGVVSMIIAGGTIISSLQSNRLISKWGTGKITAVSVGMTAAALFGFSISHSFLMLCLWAIPYGLGAGSVDAALNNFVALHFKAKHMSWLHCFWGIGATLGPYIMGFYLTRGLSWNSGYRFVFLIQLALTAILIFSMPLWKKPGSVPEGNKESPKSVRLMALIRMPGTKPAMTAFFAYCALETTTGLWGSSFMVMDRGISPDAAARWISLFYLGITIGRFFSGFITAKLNDTHMVRLGQLVAVIGILLILSNFGNAVLCAGFVLIGLGCAPIYPSLLHATPDNFGKELSQAVMGIQMACAYVGSTFIPPLAGFLVEHISMKLYPFLLLAIVLLMIGAAEYLNRIKRRRL